MWLFLMLELAAGQPGLDPPGFVSCDVLKAREDVRGEAISPPGKEDEVGATPAPGDSGTLRSVVLRCGPKRYVVRLSPAEEATPSAAPTGAVKARFADGKVLVRQGDDAWRGTYAEVKDEVPRKKPDDRARP